MYKNLKVGVVGAGYAGKLHLSNLMKIKNVQIQCICDLNQDAVSRVAKEYNIPTYYTNFDEMITKEKLDFITICTPPNTHAPLAIKAIESNLHVLIEKPLTVTTKDALDILEALKRTSNNLKVGVIHNLLFSKLVKKVRQIVERGDIGHLLNVSIIRTYPFSSDIFISNKDHWVHKMTGGRICECLPHQVYLVQEFMNNFRIIDVSAKKIGNAPWVSFDDVRITLESDSTFGSIYWSRNANRREYSIYLIGTEGTLKTDVQSGIIIKLRKSSASKNIEFIQSILSEIRQLITSSIRFYGGHILSKFGVRRANISQHEACFRSFINSIINDQKPYVDVQQGYECVRIVEDVCNRLQKNDYA